MACFSNAYGLYSPVFAVTAAGVPTVIMRITARCTATGKLDYAAAVRRWALVLFAALGFLGTVVVAVLARPFSVHIACSPDSFTAIVCISPAVMLCCIASVFRGYREGLSDVVPSAAAAIAEAVTRAVFGLGMSYAVIFGAQSAFQAGRSVFGQNCSTLAQAHNAALPYAAAAAILAVSISELAGLLTLVLGERRRSAVKLPPRKTYRVREIFGMLIRETLPISASALVSNCGSFIDLLTVTRTLSISGEINAEYYNSHFGNIIEELGGIPQLANFMYGSYTGIAMSVFMLIPSFAGMTFTSAAPEIAAANAKRDYNALGANIRRLTQAGMLIAAPACFGAAALAEPILTLLYHSRPMEVSVCVPAFTVLCLGGIFMIFSSAMFGTFQAMNKSHVPLILMSTAAIVKLSLNPLLISVPQLNIAGAALSSIIGNIITATLGGIILKKSLRVKTGIFASVLKIAICGLFCGISIKIAFSLLQDKAGLLLSIIFATFCGLVVYAILLILMGNFRSSSIIKRENRSFFEKPLEK